MAEVTLDVISEKLTLDVCPTCPAIWFDASEFESLPLKPAPPEKEDQLSPKAREQLAMLQLQRVKRQQQAETFMDGPEESWHWLAGLAGLPVETDAPKVSRIPWVTWGTIAVCVVVTLLTMRTFNAPQRGPIWEWGFIPAQWDRHGGLTLVTSFFLHAGFWHLLGNMYFLFIFGDNVEDKLGHGKYVLLILLADLAGNIAQGTFSPDATIPCVGASAGISGIIAYYAIAFPKVRLAFMFRWFLYFRWFRISAAWALVLYLLLQLIGAYFQIKGFGHVSYLGHLGGLIVGIAVAFLHKYLAKRDVELATGTRASHANSLGR